MSGMSKPLQTVHTNFDIWSVLFDREVRSALLRPPSHNL
jgi:hypothetical protein